jgi:hypothetical protein
VGTPDQSTRLAAQEAVIRRGLRDASTALATIRDERLYKTAGFASFDAYCVDCLGHGRGRADQIIAAGRVLAELPTNVVGSLNEAQVRALGSCRDHPDLVVEVLEAVRSQGKVTAAAITAEVERRRVEARELTDRLDRGLDDLDRLIARLHAAGREREALVLTEGIDTMLSHPERIEETMTGVADQLDVMGPVR